MTFAHVAPARSSSAAMGRRRKRRTELLHRGSLDNCHLCGRFNFLTIRDQVFDTHSHPVQSWTSRALLFGSFSGRSLSFEERLYGTSLFPCPHPQRPRELAYTVGFRT